MAQDSLVVANGSGAAVRAAVNAALETLATLNSGTAEPSVTYPFMWWADTTNDLLKIRNEADSAWITIGRTDLTNLGLSAIPRGFLWGMTLSNNGSDATNDIDVAAGSCGSDDATDANRVLLNPGAMTKQLDAVWASGTGAGGRISSESIANGTWHVYAFRRSGGADDYCFSQSLTPTLPDSGTNKRRIGSILRESAAIVGFVQDGDLFQRKAPVLDVNANSIGTSAVTRTLSVPTGINVLARFNSVSTQDSAPVSFYFSDLAVNDDAPSLSAAPLSSEGRGSIASAFDFGSHHEVRTNTSGQIRSRGSASSAVIYLRIATTGWVDARGRVN